MRGLLRFLLALGAPALLALLATAGAGAPTGQPIQRGAHGLAQGGDRTAACRLCHAGGVDPFAERGAWPTAVCLGCHDGAMASDVVANVPLSGIALPGLSGGGADHPVGIPLTLFSGAVATDSSAIAGLRSSHVDGRIVWWIDTEAVPNGRRDAADLVLFARRDAGRTLPYLECPTCHDPHAASGPSRLRTPNTGSRLCLACHGK